MMTNEKKRNFEMILQNHITGKISDYKQALNELNTIDLIHFNQYLTKEVTGYEIEINIHDELIIVNTYRWENKRNI